MNEEDQEPDFQELHFAFLDAIRKYEAATGWKVVGLSLVYKAGLSDVNVEVMPGAPGSSPR